MHETLYVSPAYEHLWGRPRPELIHEPSAFLHAVVHEDYAALQRLLECHGRGCAYEAEFRVRHPGGMVRWVRERGYPLRDERGVWAMAAVDVDITAWKQEEADRRVGIHESQGQLDNARLVLDAMPVAALRWDHQGHLLYRNRAADSLPEGPAAGLEGFLSAAFPDGEARGRVRDRLHGALPAWSEFATRLRSGEERVFAWFFVPMGDDSVLAFGVDVQERRNLERRLHETEANFRSLYDSNVVPLYFWRMDGRVTGANDAWLHLLGYTREELEQGRIDWVGMTPEEFRERDRQTLQEQLAGRSVAEPFEKELLRKDGSRVPVLAGGALFPDRHGGVGFAIDLSERRQAEDRLRQLNSDLNDAIAELKARQRREIGIERLTALGTLAAGVAHELNNPLMAVMNYVDYAGRTAAKPDAAGALANAQRELERMRDLLQNMLAFAGPARERTRQVEVAQIVENALTLMRPDLNQRGIAVTVEFEPALPPVPVKELQLRQVVVNLLMNARDALEEVSDRRIRIAGHRHSGFVALQVEDTGPGIPAGIQEQIFDPFFTTKPPGRGTGLGLPIARSIMLELGGDLFFDEGIQGGARFTLLIPVAEAQE